MALLLVLLLAGVLRFHNLGAECFWIDEIFSLQTSAGVGMAHERFPGGQWLDPPINPTSLSLGEGLAGILRYAPEDTQAPLYFVLLNLWRQAFGSGEAAVRSLSVVCSLGVVAILFLLARDLFERGCAGGRDGGGFVGGGSLPLAATLAAGIAAAAEGQILFAREARPYAMALLLTSIAAWMLVRIEQWGFSRVRAVVLGIALLLLMLTHYTGIAPALVMFAYAGIRLRGSARLLTLGTFVASAVVFSLIWGSTLIAQRAQQVNRLDFLSDDPAGHVTRTLDRALRQPVVALLTIAGASNRSSGELWAMRLVGGGIILVPLLLLRRWKSLLLPWMLMVSPIAMTTVSDLLQTRAGLEVPRYSILSSLGVILLAAGLIDRLRWRGAIGLLSVLMIFSVHAYAQFQRGDRKPDLRPMAEWVRSEVQPGDPLVLARGRDVHWQSGALYSALAAYAGAWPGPMIVLDSPADEAALQRLRSSRRVWMLSPTPALPATQLLGALEIGRTLTVRNMGTLGELRLLPQSIRQ
ncbi:MAG: hypothetical protein NZ561_01270 [Phycisphaerae bacterium]|nr:hypothetical protein [Phycisphaerae bacterium]MDW8261366.1 hypothetical protein [Phycisphaerales bacterium]